MRPRPVSNGMMYDAIKNFSKQFEYEPVIVNQERLRYCDKFIVLGMGGSHLAADLLRAWNPYLDIIVHRDYGLPPLHESVLARCLIIASSYSGNTEEVLDGFLRAKEKGYPVAAIAVGGKLLEYAKEAGIPYIQMPDMGIQPRSALGFSLKALFKIMGEEAPLRELEDLAENLHSEAFESAGRKLAEELRGSVPVIYTSEKNYPVAYNWKIKFNETGKIPAFFNVVPELNHNEMTGFDVKESSRELSRPFHFIIIRDLSDHFKITKRLEALAGLYRDRGLKVTTLDLGGRTQFEKIFSSLLLADWAAYYTAELYGLESEAVPMVEEFKKMIA